MNEKEAIIKLMGEVLDGTELKLKVDSYKLEENLETGDVFVRCEVHDEKSGEKQVIEGRGVGMVDATFAGFVARYADQFPSLKSIRFADFSINAKIETGQNKARSDAPALVTLRVINSEGREFAFENASRSITRSSIAVVLDTVAFFVNSERAFVQVYRALQHAKKSNRADSVARYTAQLATLVEATSYSDVIEQIRKELRS